MEEREKWANFEFDTPTEREEAMTGMQAALKANSEKTPKDIEKMKAVLRK